MKRRTFIQSAVFSGAAFYSLTILRLKATDGIAGKALTIRRLKATDGAADGPLFMGVLGPIDANDLGVTLVHEHVMADFIGAAETGTHRYKVEDVVAKAKPFLLELKKAGCKTFVDCTPVYLGRDVRVLKQLATETGMNILTTTGYYGAVEEIFLPQHAYTETAEQLAARWVNEWKNGIENTGVRPGLIKTSVDTGHLRPIYKKILTAVAQTHLQTGLTISVHTGNGVAALEEIDLLKKNGVSPTAYRWVHAQNEKDKDIHLHAAKQGAWIEFDGINESVPGNIDEHVAFVKHMKDNGFLNQVLISQDAGWYHVGEPDGGDFRGFTGLFTKFIPALKSAGFTTTDLDQLLVKNPRDSFEIKVRKQL